MANSLEYAAAPDALIPRLVATLREGPVAPALVREWSTSGEHAWATHPKASDLMVVLAYTDPRAAVRAACSCARMTLPNIRARELRPLRAIEAAEAWTREELAAHSCRKDVGAAFDAADDYKASYMVASVTATAAVALAAAADGVAVGVANAACDVVHYVATAYTEAYAVGRNRNRKAEFYEAYTRYLADVVRAIAPRPGTPQLIGAIGGLADAIEEVSGKRP